MYIEKQLNIDTFKALYNFFSERENMIEQEQKLDTFGEIRYKLDDIDNYLNEIKDKMKIDGRINRKHMNRKIDDDEFEFVSLF